MYKSAFYIFGELGFTFFIAQPKVLEVEIVINIDIMSSQGQDKRQKVYFYPQYNNDKQNYPLFIMGKCWPIFVLL